MKSTVGKKIKQLRREREITAPQLAEMVGLTSGAIYSYESGRAEPPLSVVEKIATALGIQKEIILLESKQESEFSWKDEAYLKTEQQIENLKAEVLFLRELVRSKFLPPANFLKALTKAGATGRVIPMPGAQVGAQAA